MRNKDAIREHARDNGEGIIWKEAVGISDLYKLPGEVKVYDGKGNLKQVITKEEIHKRSMAKMKFEIKNNFRNHKNPKR